MVILSNKKKIFVNSYHTKIIFKLGNKLTLKGFAQDGSIEYFSHEQKKITGIMWHPERNKKFKKIDIDIIKKLCQPFTLIFLELLGYTKKYFLW